MQRKTDKFALQWQISAHFSYYTIKHKLWKIQKHLNKIDIINIYTSLYPKQRIYSLVTFIWDIYKKLQLLGYKASLRNFQRTDT